MKSAVTVWSILALGAGVAFAEGPGINLPDFQRVYLSHSEPVVRLEESFDDLSGWTQMQSEGAVMDFTNAPGEDGACLAIRYTVPTNAWVVAIKNVAPFSFSNRCGIALRVRCTNPEHALDVKVVDSDGGYFGRQFVLGTGFADWRDVRLAPDDVQHMWGGTNTVLDEVRSIEFAVSSVGRPGSGEVFLDTYRITDETEDYIELALSQVGYHQQDAKRAILRAVSPSAGPFAFEVVTPDAATALEGSFEPTDFSRWRGRYFIGDFSGLSAPGTYRLKVLAGEQELWSCPFEVGSNVLIKGVSPAVIAFLRAMHCGDRCHPRDPILGGYHDTFYDIGKRMWSHTHLVLGLALTVEAGGVGDLDRNRTDDAMDELLYALRFMAQVQLPDGGVDSMGIGHDTQPNEFIDTAKFLFEEDTHPRILGKVPAINTTCYYVGSLCRAVPVISNDCPVVAGDVLDRARRAAEFLMGREPKLETSYEHGGFIYAMTEMYRLTGERKYLEAVPRHLVALSATQDLDASNKEIPVCGDFVVSPWKREFDFQYKYFEYNLEILEGLANVVELYDPASPEWLRASYMLNIFRECYLKPMSSLTPYRQLAHGMEKEGRGYRVAFFPPPSQPWTGAHGMNCDHLALGYAAMRMGYLSGDPWCERFADDQMQWVLGQNPLKYGMVCGVGANNPEVWSMLNNKGGPWLGEMINGIVGDRLAFPQWLVIFSSGENWLPHNAYYLALSALLDRPARLSGRVALPGAATNAGVEAVVYENETPVQSLPLDADGRFGPVDLAPQKEYRVRYEGADGWAERRVQLLSGQKEEVLLDPSGMYEARLACASKDGKTARVSVEVENRCGVAIETNIVLRVFDGSAEKAESIELSVPAWEKTRIEREYPFLKNQPLVVAVGRDVLVVPYR